MVIKATPVNIQYTSLPSLDFYVRETEDDTLFGPLNYMTATGYARRMSMLNDSGLSQVVTIVGTREGDPVDTPAHIEVVILLRRGKALLQGKIANWVSSTQTPPAP